MKNIIISLLSKENISSILHCKVEEFKDLGYCDVRYVKEGQYYIANSFFTPAWIAPTPAGPKVDRNENFIIDSVYDVATVRVFENPIQWKAVPFISKVHLQKIYDELDVKASNFINNLSQPKRLDKYIHSVKFTLTPLPTIIVSLVKDKEFIGSIAVPMVGMAYVIVKANDLVEDYVSYFNQMLSAVRYEEFSYVQLQS